MSTNIRQLDAGTWIFEEQGVRFFLLAGDARALLIDSGMQTRDARDQAQRLTDLPISLLNTHADPDHIGSNAQFDRFYMNPAEATNYYNTRHGAGEIDPVWDGDTIDLGNRPLRIVEIPGHTPGSVAVIDLNHRRAFTGDREMHAYRLSLLKLQKCADAFDEIYPSHADAPLDPSVIMELYDAAGRVLAGKVPGRDEEMHGTPITAYDAGVATFLCDRRQGGEA